MMSKVTASSFRGGGPLWLIDAQGHLLAILFYSSFLPHSLKRFLVLGKGEDCEVVDYTTFPLLTSFQQ